MLARVMNIERSATEIKPAVSTTRIKGALILRLSGIEVPFRRGTHRGASRYSAGVE
jgi:hypothetical protein